MATTPASKRPVFGNSSTFLPNYKVLLLGDAAVGKSNLISRFANNTFDPTSRSTIGVEFVSREVDLNCAGTTMSSNFSPVSKNAQREASLDDSATPCRRVVMQLWDTAGQDTFNVLTATYFRGAKGAAVVYDVTRRASLLSVGRWVAKAREYCDADCVIVVIGNKTDLAHEVEVSDEEAAAFCHSLDCRYFTASALSGEGVEYAFLQLLLSVHAMAMSSGVANALPNSVNLTQATRSSADGGVIADHSGLSGFRLNKPKPKRKLKCC